jgi:hypothetical protein
MRKGRAVLGVAALIVIATVLAPLEVAFIDFDSSAGKTQAEIVRMIHESHILDLIFLCVSVVAGCMIFSALPTSMKRYNRALVGFASIFCSLFFGILVFSLGEYYWGRIVDRLAR